MTRRLEAFFAVDATLVWRGPIGKRPGSYRLDGDRKADILVRFLMREAGLDDGNGTRVTVDQVDAVMAAAGKHGYGLEWVGGPEYDETPEPTGAP